MGYGLQAFLPSFSKYLRFQSQAFPRNVLAVLGDFNGLQPIQIYFAASKFLAR
jgi:hypothetical protein